MLTARADITTVNLIAISSKINFVFFVFDVIAQLIFCCYFRRYFFISAALYNLKILPIASPLHYHPRTKKQVCVVAFISLQENSTTKPLVWISELGTDECLLDALAQVVERGAWNLMVLKCK
jgi:hypothetical protein